MGMFDTIHANGSTYQTKAFGKSLTDYSLGDTVRLFMAPYTAEEYEEWGPLGLWVEDVPEEYQVKCIGEGDHEYRWITVTNNVIRKVGERDDKLPAFNLYGHEEKGGEA